MKNLDIIRRSGRSLRQSKIRTFLTASAIGVGAFALTLTLAASNGAQQYVNRIINDNFDPAELVVANDASVLGQANGSSKPKEYSDNYSNQTTANGISNQVKQLTDSDLDEMRQLDGVEQVREAVSPSIKYVSGTNGKKFLGTGYTFSPAQKPELYAGSLETGLHDNTLLLPQSYVSALGFRDNQVAVGQTVNLTIQKAVSTGDVESALSGGTSLSQLGATADANTETLPFTVQGIYKPPSIAQPGTENIIYLNLNDARKLNDYATQGTANYHRYSYAYVRVRDGTDAGKLTAVQNKLKSEGYITQSVKDTQKFLNQIIAVLRGIVVAFGVIALIASVFGIVNTMYISVLQRTREIGLMKALGMRKREIGRLFRVEAAWIGFLGGLLGSLLAVAVGTALNPTLTDKLQLGGSNRILVFEPVQIIVLVVLLMLIAVAAGLLPARKAAKLDPIEALRTE